jgi:hypothetical protein
MEEIDLALERIAGLTDLVRQLPASLDEGRRYLKGRDPSDEEDRDR